MKNSLIQIIAIVILILCGSVNAFAQFAGGSGTAEDPWQIETIEHLNNVRNYLGEDHADKHFIQIADINASGNNWQPIGSNNSRFMGNYNGGGYKIGNISIFRAESDYVGLFGYIQNAKINNLEIENIQVTGQNFTGSLAGTARNSTVSFITVSGNIIGRNSSGGVIGYEIGRQLSHLSADVSVSGRGDTGGVFGVVRGHVRYSYSQGVVNGSDWYIGGFAGVVGIDGEVSDSYSTADVTGDVGVGGFSGRIESPMLGFGTVHRVFSTGSVSGNNIVGGLIGSNHGTITHSYWDIETSGQETSSGGSGVTGLTTAEMQQQATFAPFNFYSVWQIDEGNGYPEFQDFSMHTLPVEVDLNELSGSGTEQNPYIVTTIDELNAIRQDLTAHYKLNSDLDATATVIWDYGKGWQPIGDNDDRFTGVFDGNGKTITGLVTNRPRNNDQGLFGYIDEAQITDLHLLQAHVYGYNATGSLAGRASNSTVSLITVTGSIVGTRDNIGGIIGSEVGGELSRLSADVSVIGLSNVGGVFGHIRGQVRYSYSQGIVTGTSLNTGGFAGVVGIDGEVSDSYSTADVTGDGRVGGFAGRIESPMLGSGTVHRVFSTGAVIGDNLVGGLIGTNHGTITHSFWNTETSGQETSSGGSGVTGLTTAEMTFPYATGVYAEWDFDTIWSHDEDHSLNDGYPHLGFGLSTSTENEEDLPRQVKLYQNYPNPFNPVTNIRYELPQQQEVRLEVFNVLGRRVAVLVSGSQQAGHHTIQFDASRLASGMYLYRLQTGNVVLTQKMMLVK